MIFDSHDHPQVIQLQAGPQKGIVPKIFCVDFCTIAGIIVKNFLHGCKNRPLISKKYYFLTLYQRWYIRRHLFYLTVIRIHTSLPSVCWVSRSLCMCEIVEETYFV